MSEGGNSNVIKGGIASAVVAVALAVAGGLDLFSNVSSLFSGPAEPVQLNLIVKIDGATGRVESVPQHQVTAETSSSNSPTSQKEIPFQPTPQPYVAPSPPVNSVQVVAPTPRQVAPSQQTPFSGAGSTEAATLGGQEFKTQGSLINAALAMDGSIIAVDREAPIAPKTKPDVLIDGNSLTYWKLGSHEIPVDVVIMLTPSDVWLAESMVIEMPMGPTPQDFVRKLKIQTAMDVSGPWQDAGTVEVKQDVGPQLFSLGAQPGRFVKVSIKSNWGGRKAIIGDVTIRSRKVVVSGKLL